MFARSILICLFLVGCSGSPLSLLAGGGPNVAANTQAGRTNVQSGVTEVSDQRVTRPESSQIEQTSGDNPIRTEQVETIVVRNDTPPWVILLLIIGWLAPSPTEIAKGIRSLFRRRNVTQTGDNE